MKKALQQKNNVPVVAVGNWGEFISAVSVLNESTVEEKINLGHSACTYVSDNPGLNLPSYLSEDLLKTLLALEKAYQFYVEEGRGKLERDLMRLREKMFDMAYVNMVGYKDNEEESEEGRNVERRLRVA